MVWIKLLVIAINVSTLGFFAYGLYSQLVLNRPFGDNSMSNNALLWNALAVFLIIIFVDWIFFFSRLETEIDDKSIRFRLFPLIRKFRVIGKDEIDSWVLRTYKPIREYGGWGIRKRKIKYRLKSRKSAGNNKTVFRALIGRSMAYTMRGNLGLQLYLKSGKEILIGTQRYEAIEKAMKRMMGEE